MELSLSECKVVIENLNRAKLEGFIEQMNDQPSFILFLCEIESIEELKSIVDNGAAADAYPSVKEDESLRALMRHHKEIMSYLDEPVDLNTSEQGFYDILCSITCSAVNQYVSQFSEITDLF